MIVSFWDGATWQVRTVSYHPVKPEVMNRFTVKPGSEPEFEQRWAKRESKLLEAENLHGDFSEFFVWGGVCKGCVFKRLTL